MDDITIDFSNGVDAYWAGTIPPEYYAKTQAELNDRTNLSPYLLGWLTAGDADNGINYFSED